MSRNNFLKIITSFALMTLLYGCSGEADEAKKLGFSSVEEMKEIHAKGWHTKEKYEEDIETYNLELSEGKPVSEKKPDENSSSVSNAYLKDEGDIALLCIYSSDKDGMGSPKILIYSPKNQVAKFGKVNPSGTWDPEYRIDEKNSNISEISLSMMSYDNLYVKNIDPKAEVSQSHLKINRRTLAAQLIIDSINAGLININFSCNILPDADFQKHVKWVHDSSNSIKNSNKI